MSSKLSCLSAASHYWAGKHKKEGNHSKKSFETFSAFTEVITVKETEGSHGNERLSDADISSLLYDLIKKMKMCFRGSSLVMVAVFHRGISNRGRKNTGERNYVVPSRTRIPGPGAAFKRVFDAKITSSFFPLPLPLTRLPFITIAVAIRSFCFIFLLRSHHPSFPRLSIALSLHLARPPLIIPS